MSILSSIGNLISQHEDGLVGTLLDGKVNLNDLPIGDIAEKAPDLITGLLGKLKDGEVKKQQQTDLLGSIIGKITDGAKADTSNTALSGLVGGLLKDHAGDIAKFLPNLTGLLK